MSITEIVNALDEEIARLVEVRKLLLGSNAAADGVVAMRSTATKTSRRKKRILSPEARKKIADAQRRRWAAQKAKK